MKTGDKMKVSDFIIEFLLSKGVNDIFGYPGGMITHLMDSAYSIERMKSHLLYHEQGCAFAACGYALATSEVGVAYSTSGPGVTNLMTGIANAFYDSIPTMFITGQVNVYEQRGELQIRQKGFQEMPVIDIVKPITKYAVAITNADEIEKEINKAYEIAITARRGPVLLDIPMNVQREQIELKIDYEEVQYKENYFCNIDQVEELLQQALRPIVIAGNGINLDGQRDEFRAFIDKFRIPVVTSMIAVDVLPKMHPLNFGFIGAYGSRLANFAVAKADLIISLGSRLDSRQTGTDISQFSNNAKLVRVDIDSIEFSRKIKNDELQLNISVNQFLTCTNKFKQINSWHGWMDCLTEIKQILANIDDNDLSKYIHDLSMQMNEIQYFTTDVGQNQVWIAQNFNNIDEQRIFFSGGHGAMGYSLPCAIGVATATHKKVVCFNGDGGLQMNLQELQTIVQNKIPIKIIVFNNKSLGMIRHFQELYFDSVEAYTSQTSGYSAPNFVEIAKAYGIEAISVNMQDSPDQLRQYIDNDLPVLIEIQINEKTFVFPKSTMGNPPYNQEPYLNRAILDKIMSL